MEISIEYYQYDPLLTSTKTLIYGRLLSSYEDDISALVKSDQAPGNATYCSIYVCKNTFIELSDGSPNVLDGRRFFLPAGERRDFLIGPQQTNDVTIGYKAG